MAVFCLKGEEMAIYITGTLTFSTQANRDAALTRINTAIAPYSYTTVATTFAAGITTPTTTTITVSIDGFEDAATAATVAKALYDAAVSVNRHTSGYLSVSKV
jgi:response regulator of citrate/malate metabolism